MSDSKVKVLYIAGFERSGSTIVNRVLGQIDGFVAWGELRDIWQHGMIENRRCTCGAFFRDCPAWTKILNEAFGGIDQVNTQEMIRLLKKARVSVLPHYFGVVTDKFFKSSVEEYLTSLESLYRAIQTTTNSKVIVDSTKASWYGYVLGMLSTIDLYVVHVIRDPRGVCHSLQQHKNKGDTACQWYNPAHASLSWNLKNSAVEMLLNRFRGRYLRIRYEDFVRNPKTAVKLVLDLVQEEVTQLPFKDDFTVEMEIDHIFAGSPSSRSETGAVKLRLDERWQNEMQPIDKAVVTSFTSPLLMKYNYLSEFYNSSAKKY
jgi:hypothetical protein